MTVTTAHVDETVNAYLETRPDQRQHLTPLLELLATGAELTGRQIFGHVTVSGVCFRSDGKIAQIQHKQLGLALQPGGHLEDIDETLIGGAVREFCEETGIKRHDVRVVGEVPIHIAVLWVPGLDVGGAEHWHFDLRFHLETDAEFGELPDDEVEGAFWADPVELVDPSLRQTVALMIGTSS